MPAFNLASNLVPNQGRGRGRGRAHGQVQKYSFAVILLDSGQSSIPRGSQRNNLNSKGRIKQFQISRGAPAATTFRKIRDLFPELQRLVINIVSMIKATDSLSTNLTILKRVQGY